MFDTLLNICKFFLDNVVKPEVIQSTNITKIDLKNQANFQDIKKFELSFRVREALCGCKGLKEVDIITFRKEFMNATVLLL